MFRLRRPCGLAGLLRGAARRHRVILHCSSLHAAGEVAGRRIPVRDAGWSSRLDRTSYFCCMQTASIVADTPADIALLTFSHVHAAVIPACGTAIHRHAGGHGVLRDVPGVQRDSNFHPGRDRVATEFHDVLRQVSTVDSIHQDRVMDSSAASQFMMLCICIRCSGLPPADVAIPLLHVLPAQGLLHLHAGHLVLWRSAHPA